MADFVIETGLKGRIQDPDALLRALGAIMLAQAQAAFKAQRLGSIPWKRRYPNQKPPLINIAGALADFRMGSAEPKSRRFVGRPAGVNTSALRLSLAKENSEAMKVRGGRTVEVGSNLPYASVINSGGYSSQPVTDDAKKRMAKWMAKLRGKRRKGASYDASSRTWGPKKKSRGSKGGKAKKGSSGSGAGSKAKSGKKGTKTPSRGGGSARASEKLKGPALEKFKSASGDIKRAQKMGFLFSRSRLKTKVVARPFLGFTTHSIRAIKKKIEEEMGNG